MQTMKQWIVIICCLISINGCASIQSAKQNPVAANYNIQLGLDYLQKKMYPKAKQKLLLAMSQAPKNPEALDALAYFYQVTGNKAYAQQFYEKAIAIAPQSGRALNNYGVFLCTNRQYSKAIQLFLQAANQVNYIHTAKAYENAALCSLKAHNKNKAELYFKKAIHQNPHLKSLI